MGSITLSHEENPTTFCVEWASYLTFVGGDLQECQALAIALHLVADAEMSRPEKTGEDMPPDSQGGTVFYRSRLVSNEANATALLATGFHADEKAAEVLASFDVPLASIERLRQEIREAHAEFLQKAADRTSSGPPWRVF